MPSFCLGEENLNDRNGFSISDDRGVKYLSPVGESYRLNVGGYYSKQFSEIEGEDFDYFSISIGLRKYFIARDRFRYFVDLEFLWPWLKIEKETSFDKKRKIYEAYYGIEYLLEESISVEGKFGIGVSYDVRNDKSILNLNLPISALAINYYMD